MVWDEPPWGLSQAERVLLGMGEPKPSRALAACRNLALRSPLLRAEGITTELDEENRVVLVRRDELGFRLTATEAGWISDPPHPDLHRPLDSCVALERILHRLLTGDLRESSQPGSASMP
jgi:hypothetical protein